MASIFISYRRQDSEWAARGLYERFRKHFGEHVFMDVDTIQPGDDFVEVIEAAVGQCDALIALIGTQWLDVCDEAGNRRLGNETDFIRLEIATALKRSIRVIPVLIDGASMPSEDQLPGELKILARRHAVEIRPRTFSSDTTALIDFLQRRVFQERPQRESAEGPEVKHWAETSTEPPVPRSIFEGGAKPSGSSKDGNLLGSSTEAVGEPHRPTPQGKPPVPTTARGDNKLTTADFGARVEAIFDRDTYTSSKDPLARFLVELEFNPPDRSVLEEVPSDIGLVLDVSGSMRKENRFGLLCDAVREFLQRLPEKDRAAIVLFSTEASAATGFIQGVDARSQADDVLDRIKNAPVLFGRKTNLAPGLGQILGLFDESPAPGQAVKRIYVLTDGRLHDAKECRQVLPRVRELRAEIGIYGFGGQLDVNGLKALLGGQYGGWVKRIDNKQDVVQTFAHVTKVSRALVAQEARFAIAFDKRVTAGDVWAFRPQARYFGQVQGRRYTCDAGPAEAGRVYSLMLEVRLPPETKPTTPVALVRGLWRHGNRVYECRTVARATRTTGDADAEKEDLGIETSELDLLDAVDGVSDRYTIDRIQQLNRAGQAFLLLNELCKKKDLESELVARRAERVIAQHEGRSTKLLDALDKKIRHLEEIRRFEQEMGSGWDDELVLEASEMSAEEEMLVAADEASDIALSLSGDDSDICLEDLGHGLNLEDDDLSDVEPLEP